MTFLLYPIMRLFGTDYKFKKSLPSKMFTIYFNLILCKIVFEKTLTKVSISRFKLENSY